MIESKEGVQALYDAAAEHRNRRTGGGDELMLEMGIERSTFADWNTDDVLDTFHALARSGQIPWEQIPTGPESPVRISAAMLGTIMCTHVEVALQAGYLLGKGEISAD